MNNTKEGASKEKTPDWLKKNGKNLARYGIMGIALVTLEPALSQISSQSGPYYDALVHTNEVISSNPLSLYLVNTLNQLTHIFSEVVPQFHPEDVPTVHIMEFLHGLAIVGGPLEHLLENIFTSKREARKLLGLEPLRRKESPKHVFIGPSQIISDMAEELYKDEKKTKRQPVVAIHTDESIPARYGQEVEYHYRTSDPAEILDTFPTQDERSFIEVTGLDRADEITTVCFNPDNAIFYGNQSNVQVTPDFASSLIRNLPKEKLKGKKINIVLNETKLFGQTTEIEEELENLSKKIGFKLNVIKPEQQVLVRIKSEANKIKTTEKKRIALVGQGGKNEDKLMISTFIEAINSLDKNYEVEFIDNERMEKGKVGDHDLYICYGDTDKGTSTLSALTREKLVKQGKIDSRVMALVERNNSLKEYAMIDGVKAHSIYQMVIDKMMNKPIA